MKPLAIRFKLTAWYLAVLVATIAIFGAAAFLTMRKGIDVSVDEGLEDQASAIERLAAEALPRGRETLAEELREHSELRPGGNFSQNFQRRRPLDISVPTYGSPRRSYSRTSGSACLQFGD